MERFIAVDTADGPMQAFVTEPAGTGRAAALLVCQEAFGVKNRIKNVCHTPTLTKVMPCFTRLGFATFLAAEQTDAAAFVASYGGGDDRAAHHRPSVERAWTTTFDWLARNLTAH
jgi:hypothetical protein